MNLRAVLCALLVAGVPASSQESGPPDPLRLLVDLARFRGAQVTCGVTATSSMDP